MPLFLINMISISFDGRAPEPTIFPPLLITNDYYSTCYSFDQHSIAKIYKNLQNGATFNPVKYPIGIYNGFKAYLDYSSRRDYWDKYITILWTLNAIGQRATYNDNYDLYLADFIKYLQRLSSQPSSLNQVEPRPILSTTTPLPKIINNVPSKMEQILQDIIKKGNPKSEHDLLFKGFSEESLRFFSHNIITIQKYPDSLSETAIISARYQEYMKKKYPTREYFKSIISRTSPLDDHWHVYSLVEQLVSLGRIEKGKKNYISKFSVKTT